LTAATCSVDLFTSTRAPGGGRVSAPHTLELKPPLGDEPSPTPMTREIRRRERLGGLIHEYYRAAA
jgi:hypothetical protein